jgi:putative spermidine/putrescine transport system ATP-binding protein
MRKLEGSEIRRRVTEALELVGLGQYLHRVPSQLSGGQQQRVAVARALIYRPSLMLMDEPLGALDKYLRERLQVEIKRIARATGVTILYVTHDQAEALSMSDRIAVMFESRLHAIGTPLEVYDRPRTRLVAEFVGDCNFLPGRVVASNGPLAEIAVGENVVVGVSAERKLEVGGAVTVCIRPESIVCARERDARRTNIPATITDMVYLGDIVRYHLAVPAAGSQIVLHAKSLKPIHTLSCGDEVFVQWNAEDAWAINEGNVQR